MKSRHAFLLLLCIVLALFRRLGATRPRVANSIAPPKTEIDDISSAKQSAVGCEVLSHGGTGKPETPKPESNKEGRQSQAPNSVKSAEVAEAGAGSQEPVGAGENKIPQRADAEEAIDPGQGLSWWVRAVGILLPTLVLYFTFIAPNMSLRKDLEPTDRFETIYSRDAAKMVGYTIVPIIPLLQTDLEPKLRFSFESGKFTLSDLAEHSSGQGYYHPPESSLELSSRAVFASDVWGPTSTSSEYESLKDSSVSEEASGNLPETIGQIADDRNLTPGAQLLMAEFEKCAAEIRLKQEQEDAWVRHKLLFIGTLIGGFIVYVILSGEKPLDAKLIRYTLSHGATVVMLSVAFVGSLITDMQIRALRVVTNENGLWIRHFVEPVMLGQQGGESGNQGEESKRPVLGWESFLRASVPEANGGPGGHHTDFWFTILFWPDAFLITNLIYLAFAYTYFWQLCFCSKSSTVGADAERRLRMASYSLVHSLIVVCAVSTHIVPDIFELSKPFWAFWLPDGPNKPSEVSFYYAVPALFVVALSLIAHCLPLGESGSGSLSRRAFAKAPPQAKA